MEWLNWKHRSKKGQNYAVNRKLPTVGGVKYLSNVSNILLLSLWKEDKNNVFVLVNQKIVWKTMAAKKTSKAICLMTTTMIMMMMKRKGKTFIPVRVTNLNFLRTISIHVHNHEKKSVMRIYSQMITKGITLWYQISFNTFSQLCPVRKCIQRPVLSICFFGYWGLKVLNEKLYKSYISAFLWKSSFYKWINSLQIPYNKIS